MLTLLSFCYTVCNSICCGLSTWSNCHPLVCLSWTTIRFFQNSTCLQETITKTVYSRLWVRVWESVERMCKEKRIGRRGIMGWQKDKVENKGSLWFCWWQFTVGFFLPVHRTKDIGVWFSVMQAMVFASILTNCAIMSFSSEQMMQWLPWLFERSGEGGDQTPALGRGR